MSLSSILTYCSLTVCHGNVSSPKAILISIVFWVSSGPLFGQMSLCVIQVYYPNALFYSTKLSALMHYSAVPLQCLNPIYQTSIPSQCSTLMTMHNVSVLSSSTESGYLSSQHTYLSSVHSSCVISKSPSKVLM